MRAAWVDFTLVARYGSEYTMHHSTPVMMSLHAYQDLILDLIHLEINQ